MEGVDNRERVEERESAGGKEREREGGRERERGREGEGGRGRDRIEKETERKRDIWYNLHGMALRFSKGISLFMAYLNYN